MPGLPRPDREVIGDERSPRPLPVFQLDDNRSFRPPRSKLLEAAPLVPGPAQTARKALGKKREYVEKRGLPASIRAQEHCERSQSLQPHIVERPVIADPQELDPGDGTRDSSSMDHVFLPNNP